jgi:hypothetical protein
MELVLNTYYQQPDATLGLMLVNGLAKYHTIERPYHKPRIPNASCIYAGRYEIVPRTRSAKVDEYKRRFPWFRYHLQLKDVPDADYILIHIANFITDVEGCIGIAYGSDLYGKQLVDSMRAFRELSLDVYRRFDDGESAWITINRLEET